MEGGRFLAAKDAKSAEGVVETFGCFDYRILSGCSCGFIAGVSPQTPCCKGEEVIESKSLYNRFVDFVFFVVKKDWEEGRGTEARCGSAESKTRKRGGKFFDKILIGG